MPELPEVETVARGLAAVLVGATLARVVLRRPDLRRVIPPDLPVRLTGATVTSVFRRAKYALIETDRGDIAILHLGMSGSIALDTPGDGPHDHVLFETMCGRRLSFNDPRRFGSLDLARVDTWEAHAAFAGMGPEPLGNSFSAPVLSAALHGRRTPIKAALLDQHVVAGLGNIYVCEALHIAGISPRRMAASVAGARAARLVPAIRAVLERAIAAGGSTLRDHAQVDGTLGYFQHQFAVYGRAGQPCPTCSTPIRRVVQSGRSTFFCSRCQR